MKSATGIILIILFSLIILHPVFSENNDDGEKEIEDLYLQNPELMLMEKEAFSSDRYTQLEALKTIENYLNGLRPGNNEGDAPLEPINPDDISPQIEEVLIHLASQGTLIISKKGNSVVNDFPEVRRKACELLGWVRTENSKEALINFLKKDPEPMVKAEAAWALGEYAKYEGDGKGDITIALAWVIERESLDNPDNNLAYAIILSLEKIAEKHNGGLPHPDGYIALIKIAQGNYINTVTKKALEVIQSLGKK